jgi:DNA-binding NarL/FixJ family response regulator
VVVLDDHPVIRQGIDNFFEFAEDVELVGTAPDAAQASKKHVENIRHKLGATDRAGAVAEGFRRGLVR